MASVLESKARGSVCASCRRLVGEISEVSGPAEPVSTASRASLARDSILDPEQRRGKGIKISLFPPSRVL